MHNCRIVPGPREVPVLLFLDFANPVAILSGRQHEAFSRTTEDDHVIFTAHLSPRRLQLRPCRPKSAKRLVRVHQSHVRRVAGEKWDATRCVSVRERVFALVRFFRFMCDFVGACDGAFR